MRAIAWAGLLGALCAAVPAILLYDFTVDDALIGARYAANLASGAGYRFNVTGPVTDGVTPLGWAPLLSLWADGGVLAALGAAKKLGMACWLAGAALLGMAVGTMGGSRARWAALALVVCSAPLGAWSAAGMETGLALGLGAAAVAARCLRCEKAAAACAGLVAGLRPEALPWALALAAAPARGQGWREAARVRAARLLLAAAPFVAVAAIRAAVFGRPAPLAVLAKPSDLTHGAYYALACLLLAGPPALFAWRGLPPWVRGLQAAVLVHFVAIALAGGDWMPLSRLAVPALPAAVVAAGGILAARSGVPGWGRLAVALAAEIFVLVRIGPAAAAVGTKRLAVIEELGPALRQARVVAALDIGWVGAATGAEIVDLAGVTDPGVAALPGGHTSKAVSEVLLASRHTDALVLLLDRGAELRQPWTQSRFARQVERRVAALPAMESEYAVATVAAGPLPYVVLRRRAESP
ncbi:MAG: hypothetical protein HY744_27300 [Deltaproteobacteria bacterium]|nr:hypothetical protein [Deltaproteobacteria bacterium]